MRRTIAPAEVMMGMQVLGFEGSWLSHPFWRRNFRIEDADVLRKVRESAVTGVIVEVEVAPRPAARPATPSPAPAALAKARKAAREEAVAAPSWPTPQITTHSTEFERATLVIHRARNVMVRVLDQARLGRAVRASDVSAVVDEISEAVQRNPAAMVNVARLKSKTEYTYMHSVAVCTLMINMARQLGLPEETYKPIGLAGLLHDVGKVTIPDEILDKTGPLTDAEFHLIKAHTLNGRDLIADGTDVPDIAIDVCTHHHEKMDGSGYPFGHQAQDISLHARMGAICDVYDALTSDRSYKAGWKPQEALVSMGGWQGHFDEDLLFQFMRSVGIFAPGMLVELRSQRLAIIVPGKRANAPPRARAFYDLRSRDFIAPDLVQLDDSLRHDQALRAADPDAWRLPDWDTLRTSLLAGKDPRPLLDAAM